MPTEGRRYRILGLLGRGGFGTVYRAELLGEGGFVRQVALKVLNPEVEGIADVARRLRDEARLLGLLRHRAILQVDGLVRLDDRWTIVMEFIDGVDVATLLNAGPVPTGAALEILSEVASALHIAYSWPMPGTNEPLKLLHRDIKPSNVVITAAGETKVLDFGIARANFGGREAMTKSVIFGSPGYMAPERLDLEEGPAGDVYSLGVLLHEMLVGTAFGKASPRPDKHQALIEDAIGRQQQRGVPEPVQQFSRRLLAYEPTARPTAREAERTCRDLRSQVAGLWLRDWAEQVVPPLLENRGLGGQHDFSRSVLTERSTTADTVGFSIPPDEGAPLGAARTFDDDPPPAPAAPIPAGIPPAAPIPTAPPTPPASVQAAPAPIVAAPPPGVPPKSPPPQLVIQRPRPVDTGPSPVLMVVGALTIFGLPILAVTAFWFFAMCCGVLGSGSSY